MIRKYKIYIIMGITVLLLFMVLPVDTKGDWEIPWDITLEGEGNDPAFRSSTVMEIFLKNGTAPKDITVFVNQQKINPIWDYEQSTQISFQEEGIYKVHIVHKNGYEEIRQVMVELNNPTTAKITAGAYTPGAWSKKNVVLEAYGAKAVSDIQFYEYKIGQDEWKQMKKILYWFWCFAMDVGYEDDEIVFLIDQTFRRQGIIMPQAYIKETKADSTYKIKNETLNDVFGLQSDEYFHVPKKKMPKEEYVKQMDDKKTAMTKAVTSLFYKGLTVAQIAEELHISKRTVISRKNDAKKFGWIPFRGKFFEKSLCWTA